MSIYDALSALGSPASPVVEPFDVDAWASRALRTESTRPVETLPARRVARLRVGLSMARSAEFIFDGVKRETWYGKFHEWSQWQFRAADDLVIGDGLEADLPIQGTDKNLVRLVHAAIGLFTESCELATAVVGAWLRGASPDATNVAEELGDIAWYLALACDALGVPLSKVMAANEAKLRARYPDAFSEAAAVQRNSTTEQAVVAEIVSSPPPKAFVDSSDDGE